MAGFTQQGRLLNLTTPLGNNALLLRSFTGEEALSRPFSFTLELLADPGQTIDPTKLIGQTVTWTVNYGAGRVFNAYVRHFRIGPLLEGFRTYQMEVVPWLWFLTRTSDCKVFQNSTPLQIITQIFQGLNFSDFKTSQVTSSLPTLEYCVQYRETDFQFVSRLMEQYGIFFFFLHTKGKHTLVLTDNTSAYSTCSDSKVTYTSGAIAGDFLFEWERGYNFFTGQWTQTDYNYLTPTANMSSTTTTVQPLSMAKQYEFYDYPGGYTAKANGQSLTQIRMEAEELTYNEVKGAGTYSSFCPAGTFTVSSHDNSAEVGQSCVLTAVRHQAHEVGYLQCDQGRESFYQNRFTCIPASSTFRPARLTPQPVVRGPETALVVGPSGEEIYVNQYGCIKIQMFWDRVGQKNENSSCWVRLAQGWSGSGWGMQFLPRIGQEVVVEFLDGDPDSPIVTGCVHNAQNLPPFTLNTNMTQSGIKTRSTKGGNASTFNQLLFEDKNGSEAIIIQAQKDLNCTVNNNDTLVVSGDQSVTITNNRTTVLNKGNDSTTIQAGTSSLTAAKQITFSVGGNSITIDSSGITIKGMNITLQGQTQVQVQAPSINATADTALQLKGAIVNIN